MMGLMSGMFKIALTRAFMTRGYKARTNRSPSTNAGPESWSRVKHVGS